MSRKSARPGGGRIIGLTRQAVPDRGARISTGQEGIAGNLVPRHMADRITTPTEGGVVIASNKERLSVPG